jgi:c-di-GMP-binding flagellar brake protein YcgR
MEGHYTGRYNARVQDSEKTTIFIEMPLKQDARNPTVLPDGTEVMVRYRSVDGALCSFHTQVKGRENRGIPLLGLVRPKLSDIHRQQRREYLRVPISATFDLVYMEYQTNRIITATVQGIDISGGGVAWKVEKDLPIQANDVIGFRFVLVMDGKGQEIMGKARVIRVSLPNELGFKTVSCKFIELTDADRQKVIQYSFKRQLEMREKGILG